VAENDHSSTALASLNKRLGSSSGVEEYKDVQSIGVSVKEGEKHTPSDDSQFNDGTSGAKSYMDFVSNMLDLGGAEAIVIAGGRISKTLPEHIQHILNVNEIEGAEVQIGKKLGEKFKEQAQSLLDWKDDSTPFFFNDADTRQALGILLRASIMLDSRKDLFVRSADNLNSGDQVSQLDGGLYIGAGALNELAQEFSSGLSPSLNVIKLCTYGILNVMDAVNEPLRLLGDDSRGNLARILLDTDDFTISYSVSSQNRYSIQIDLANESHSISVDSMSRLSAVLIAMEHMVRNVDRSSTKYVYRVLVRLGDDLLFNAVETVVAYFMGGRGVDEAVASRTDESPVGVFSELVELVSPLMKEKLNVADVVDNTRVLDTINDASIDISDTSFRLFVHSLSEHVDDGAASSIVLQLYRQGDRSSLRGMKSLHGSSVYVRFSANDFIGAMNRALSGVGMVDHIISSFKDANLLIEELSSSRSRIYRSVYPIALHDLITNFSEFSDGFSISSFDYSCTNSLHGRKSFVDFEVELGSRVVPKLKRGDQYATIFTSGVGFDDFGPLALRWDIVKALSNAWEQVRNTYYEKYPLGATNEKEGARFNTRLTDLQDDAEVFRVFANSGVTRKGIDKGRTGNVNSVVVFPAGSPPPKGAPYVPQLSGINVDDKYLLPGIGCIHDFSGFLIQVLIHDAGDVFGTQDSRIGASFV